MILPIHHLDAHHELLGEKQHPLKYYSTYIHTYICRNNYLVTVGILHENKLGVVEYKT
jgi:hypothetical protein